jgi:hypothetical protein
VRQALETRYHALSGLWMVALLVLVALAWWASPGDRPRRRRCAGRD